MARCFPFDYPHIFNSLSRTRVFIKAAIFLAVLFYSYSVTALGQCILTIDKVEGSGESPVVSITVEGTVAHCPSGKISLEIVCGSSTGLTMTFPVTEDGPLEAWKEVFDIINADCECDESIILEAKCVGTEEPGAIGETCKHKTKFDNLSCPNDCPPITVKVKDPPSDCISGKRSVTLDATLDAAWLSEECVYWNWDDGTLTIFSILPGQTIPKTHDYLALATPVNYNPVLITCPPGIKCEYEILPPVTIDPCPCSDMTISVSPTTGLDIDGTTLVIEGCASISKPLHIDFSSAISPPMPCAITWKSQKGMTVVDIGTGASVSHDYTEPGTYTISAAAACGECPPVSAGVTIKILPCCPELIDIEENVYCPEGCEPQKKAFEAITDPSSAPGTYSWTFEDGMPASAMGITTPIITFSTLGSKTVNVTFTPTDRTCESSFLEEEVAIERCPKTTTEEPPCGGWVCFFVCIGWSIMLLSILILVFDNVIPDGLPLAVANAGLLAVSTGIIFTLGCPCCWAVFTLATLGVFFAYAIVRFILWLVFGVSLNVSAAIRAVIMAISWLIAALLVYVASGCSSGSSEDCD